MGDMDTTRDLHQVLDRLREADPAAAPDLADQVATRLARLLEEEDVGADDSPPAEGDPVRKEEPN